MAYFPINSLPSSGGASSFSDLDDVNINSLTLADGDIAVYDSASSKWVNASGIGISLTQAEYNALTPQEKASGTYWITDASSAPLATEIAMSASDSTSVAEKIEEVTKTATQTLTYNNTVPFVFTRKGEIVEIKVNHTSQTSFPNSWSTLGTLSADLKPTVSKHVGMIFPNGYFLQFRFNANSGLVEIYSSSTNNLWAQGSTIYLI